MKLTAFNMAVTSKQALLVLVNYFMQNGLEPLTSRVDAIAARVFYPIGDAVLIFNYTTRDGIKDLGYPVGAAIFAVANPLSSIDDLKNKLNEAGIPSESGEFEPTLGLFVVSSSGLSSRDPKVEPGSVAGNVLLFFEPSTIPPRVKFNYEDFKKQLTELPD